MKEKNTTFANEKSVLLIDAEHSRIEKPMPDWRSVLRHSCLWLGCLSHPKGFSGWSACNWTAPQYRWLSLVPCWGQYRLSPCCRSRRTALWMYFLPYSFFLFAKLNINELDLDTQIGDKRCNSISHMLNLTLLRVMICKPFFFLNPLFFAFSDFSACHHLTS